MFDEEKSRNIETEQTAVFSGVKTNFIQKCINKCKKVSKKRLLWIIGIIILVIVLSAAALAAWWYFSPYATIDGQTISRSQYDDMKSKLEQFYKYNKGTNSQKDAEQSAKDRLIEEKIVESEAKKRGITASDEEINKRYQSIVSNYKNEDEYIKTIKSTYNWTPELTKQTIKTEILIEELQKVVLQGYDVSFIHVRFDMGEDESVEDPNALPSVNNIYNRLKSGEEWEKIYNEYSNMRPNYSIGGNPNINSQTQYIFPDRDSWKAISQIKNVGDITQPVKSVNGGYYVIYHVNRINGGDFNSWQQFINDYKNKYVSYGSLDTVNRWIGSLLTQKVSAKGLCDSSLCKVDNTQNAKGDEYHPQIYAGDVKDSNTGLFLGDVSVRVYTPSTNVWQKMCDGNIINAASYDKTVKSAYSNTTADIGWDWGGDPTWVWSTPKTNYHFGTAMTGCGVIRNGPDCHILDWRVTFSKTGYVANYTQGTTGQPSGRDYFELGETLVGSNHDNGNIVLDSVTMTPTVAWEVPPTANVININDINGVSTGITDTAYVDQTIYWNHRVSTEEIKGDISTVNTVVEYKFQDGRWFPERNSYDDYGSGGANNFPVKNPHDSFQSEKLVKAGDIYTYVCRRTVVSPTSSTGLPLQRQSAYACVWIMNPGDTRPKSWSISASAVVSSITDSGGNNTGITTTAKPGDVIEWSHTITNNGPDNLTSNVFGLDQQLDTVSNLYKSVGGYMYLLEGSLPGTTKEIEPRPTYSVLPSDVGKNICRRTYAEPGTIQGGSVFSSPDACVFIPYDYELKPVVTLSYLAVEPGTAIEPFLSVDNSGPTFSKLTKWKLTRLVGTNPSEELITGSDVVFPVGSPSIGTPPLPSSYPDIVPDVRAGTDICYILSVQPRAHDDDNWIDSNKVCVVVSKKPKVQVWGSDLWTDGLVNTSQSLKSGNTFGSWVEYGMIAKGTITGTASGSAFAKTGLVSATLDKYNSLSFANTGNTVNCNPRSSTDPKIIGCYSSDRNINMPKVAASFTGGSSITANTTNLLSSDTYTAGDITLEAGNLGLNKSIIIKSTGTVTINDDQTYTSGPYKTISEIPQLIIIAKNIIINDGVEEVNAWLIASDSVKTCSLPAKTVDKCSSKLIVNGPVMTNQLYLWRTAGSDPGSESGEPAEVFNLRADAYLWSMSRSVNSGRIQTVYSTELPPRL